MVAPFRIKTYFYREMAPKSKKSSTKKYRGKRRVGGKRKRSSRNVPEKASMSVTRSYSMLSTNQSYRVYDIQLSQYARAVNTAKSFQLYRIKSAKLKLSPLYDTFTPGSGTSTVPYVYFQVDRTRDLQNIRTAQEFKQLGCKPHRLDDNIVAFTWRPSVLNTTLDDAGTGGGVFNQYKISPWIRCRDETGAPGIWNPDTTDHLGLVFLAENSQGNDLQFKAELIIEFEFCKPSYPTTITEGSPEPVALETLAIEL